MACEKCGNCSCDRAETPPSKVRSVGIKSFSLLDVDEAYAPPAQPVLTVSLLYDGLVSLAIEHYDETHDFRSYNRIASIIVDLEPLVNGLNASMLSEGKKLK